MQRIYSYWKKGSSDQSQPPPAPKAHKKRQARPAMIQYLDEQGNPKGEPFQILVPGSSRSSSVASSSRKSISTGSSISQQPSMSSLSSHGSRHATDRRRSASLKGARPSKSEITPQAQKAGAPVEEIRPADFKDYTSISKHKGRCEACKKTSNQASLVLRSKRPSRIPNRPSIEALINKQQDRGAPRPECEHDELELEEHLGWGYTDYDSFVPERTSKGQLVWVSKPGSTHRWRD